MKKKTPENQPALGCADFLREVDGFDYTGATQQALLAAITAPQGQAGRFAALQELVYRQTGLRLFGSQLACAHALIGGKLAQLPTGEGKTLAAVVAAACLALDGRKVQVLVFNDYLARRDCATAHDILAACGLSCGYITQHTPPAQRRAAYGCNVTYVSAREAGFDVLRDFLCTEADELVFPGFDAALVDEADSILIDECTTPLVLAGQLPPEHDRTGAVDACVRRLTPADVELDTGSHQVWLTDSGLARMEALLNAELYNDENVDLLAAVQNALEAHHLLHRDDDYIVKDGAVRIVEGTTGRVVLNKRYPDLLHRAVEIKEGLEPAPLTMIYNQMTMRDFLLQYPALCGMTGTIATAAEEVWDAYGLEVEVVPPHTPCIRADLPDALLPTMQAYYAEVIQQVAACHSRGQPVLMGTQSVAESEAISALLEEAKIPHVVLNAKNDEEEAALIAEAGRPGRVTISTNMAGRGVDIKLGGSDEAQRQAVVAAGGLFVVGAGINPSLRIDNQLRGRAGRQGDPGQSRFFVCLEDVELTTRLSAFQRVRARGGSARKRQNTIRHTQRIMEGEAAGARHALSRFSCIIETQRAEVTALRGEVLAGRHHFGWLQQDNPQRNAAILQAAGQAGLQKAERQLALYHINRHWASYLATMEVVRSGIHFMTIGHRSPRDEYNRIAIATAADMLAGIRADVVADLVRLPVTENGIDMQAAGLGGGTTTWTYAIDESQNQFSRLRHLVNNARQRMTGENGLLTGLYERLAPGKDE